MKNQGRVRVLGCVALGVLGAVSACSDDTDPVPPEGVITFAGSANIAGVAMGGSGGASGSASGGSATSGSGGSLTLGGTGGTGGTQSGAGAPSAGAGGETGGAGGGEPSGGGEGGEGGAGGNAGQGGEAGAGGEGGTTDAPEPACNYTEVESDFNIATGIRITSAVKTLCGKVDPGHFQADEKLVDRDGLDVSIGGEADVLVRLEMPNRGALSRVEVWLNGGMWLVQGDQTVFRIRLYSPTVYTLALRAYSDGDIAEAVPYTLSVGTDDVSARCAKPSSVSFTEAADGATHTGNDVFQFSGSYTASLTPGADAPEATNLTLGATGTRLRFDGVSAAAGEKGPYYDADSYTFRSGATAQQVTVVADWATQSDLDIFLFKAGALPDQVWSITRSMQPSEYFTFMLEPNTDYQVYAAGYNGVRPFDYSLTLCSEKFDIRGK